MFKEINNYRIAYKRKGAGVPVLFLHGVASYSFLWDGIVQRLSDRYDCIATDLLGCGSSDKPNSVDYSIAAQADIMMQLIDDLDIAPLHLVGHDIGGGIAQIMAVRRPEQLIDLTLINPVGYDYWPVQPITLMRLPVIRSFITSIMHPNLYRLILRRALYHEELLDDELFDKFWEPVNNMKGKNGFVQLIRCINNQLLLDITEQLRQLQLPTLLVRGDADTYLSSKIVLQLSQDIPKSQTEHIVTGGHFMQIDEPDKVSDLLARFFLKQDEV